MEMGTTRAVLDSSTKITSPIFVTLGLMAPGTKPFRSKDGVFLLMQVVGGRSEYQLHHTSTNRTVTLKIEIMDLLGLTKQFDAISQDDWN